MPVISVAPRSSRALACALVLVAASCGGEHQLDQVRTPIVYGSDGRIELFELDEGRRAAFADSVVALIPASKLELDGSSLAERSQREAQLCPGERFAEQPDLAFCSGVLIEDDLVLTAAHCLRVMGLTEFRVALDYYYADSQQLAAFEAIAPEAILAEQLDEPGRAPRLDFGLLQLQRGFSRPRRNPAVYRRQPTLQADDSLYFVAPSGGSPLKADTSGKVVDARSASGDWFTASTDSRHGSSGGGAFDASLGLVGILARGAADYELTAEGCYRERVITNESSAEEQLSYVAPALDMLCAAHPERSLCRTDCSQPCVAVSKPEPAASSCALRPSEDHGTWPGFILALFGLRRLCGRRRDPPPLRRAHAPRGARSLSEEQRSASCSRSTEHLLLRPKA